MPFVFFKKPYISWKKVWFSNALSLSAEGEDDSVVDAAFVPVTMCDMKQCKMGGGKAMTTKWSKVRRKDQDKTEKSKIKSLNNNTEHWYFCKF